MIKSKSFRITENGFIKVTKDGREYQAFFYRPGDENYWLNAGYEQVFI